MKITATPQSGTTRLGHLAQSMEIGRDIDQDTVGECVTAAIQNATKAGFKPDSRNFHIEVRFENV